LELSASHTTVARPRPAKESAPCIATTRATPKDRTGNSRTGPGLPQPCPAQWPANGHQDRDSIGLALVRWGLLISLSLAILALGAIWITGALITPGHASAAMAEAGLNDVGPTKNGASRAMHETEHQPSP
jgi:hypothetical protein